MMSILRWLNSVSLELFYPFAVYINLLIMTRILAGNKLLNKQKRMRANWEKWPAVVCRELFCFRPSAHHVILERAQVLSIRTLPEKCDKCDSACSVDFHRKFKQTTISQNLLIKSWRQLPKILFMSPFRQWKPQNKFLRSSFVTQSSFS